MGRSEGGRSPTSKVGGREGEGKKKGGEHRERRGTRNEGGGARREEGGKREEGGGGTEGEAKKEKKRAEGARTSLAVDLRHPEIESGAFAWEANMLPLHQWRTD